LEIALNSLWKTLILFAILGLLFVSNMQAEDEVDFAREVLPILSNKCFVCHGPDTKEEDLVRLDSREGAIADLGGYRAIDAADLAKSAILLRIHSTDEPMPPEDAEKQLTESERKLINRWVLQGGEYAQHWAFVKPVKQEPPKGSLNPIDAFVQRKLQLGNLEVAPRAERSVLARRVALTLTGLPPEPAQLDAFLKDETPESYERFVDALLVSPQFGEHQARYWLDAVRYGDTHGLHLDNRRGIYPYRDWVVRAFNMNLPLDDFLTWQLAGDLLPNPTLEQQVATGFVRMNPTTSEGGAIAAEFQAKNNFDRTEMLGTVLLGMTLNCSRCHTHKYDPIQQTEYYQLMAFFNSTAESAMDRNAYLYGPVASAPADQHAWNQWAARHAKQTKLIESVSASQVKDWEQFKKHAATVTKWKSKNWQQSPVVTVDAQQPEATVFTPIAALPGKAKEKLPAAKQAVWLRFSIDASEATTLWLTTAGGAGSQVIVGNETTTIEQDSGKIRQPVLINKGAQEITLKLVGVPSSPQIEVSLSDPWADVLKSASWKALSSETRILLLGDAYGPLADLKKEIEVAELTTAKTSAENSYTTTLVAKELATPRETKLLHRGEYDQPKGEALQPGILQVMGSFPEGAPRNRLGLAEWLTSDDHPAVRRVLVNRLWQRVFGRGLVRTPEDFGLQGEQPTHPELLDWLAVELSDSGWDMKRMLKLMVMSDTFQQSSTWRTDLDDPENRLWARGPSYRLDAEVLRDIALWSSELLDPHMGGEGVKPYQPSGMWAALAHPASNTKKYEADKGERLYRRSLYVYWKRTSPHPMMTLFDAPNRESSCVARSRTNTSLQSLGLLNETQRLETARKLAERLLKNAETDEARFTLLYQLLASRSPSKSEQSTCALLLAKMRKRYEVAENDATSLLAAGEAPRDETLPAIEVAAWTQLTIIVMASDAAIMLY